uniref:Tyrosine-protein phosphatase domain-containing protein n=1 Tax=Mesocestoides corti TaxID=53468 RepID=A0A5K3FJT5_MESCO
MGGKITKVVPGLYIGANENVRDDEDLIANCISHILSVQSSDTNIKKLSNHVYHKVFVGEPDTKGLLRVIPEANDFIHGARVASGNVLVHSESGMSSNVAVVAAYLMTVYQLDRKTAIATLQGLVPAVQPIPSLQNQLDRFYDNGSVEVDGKSVITAATERERLEKKFGRWPGMETDKRFLQAALTSHDNLKASGAFLLSSGESRSRQQSVSPPPATPDVPKCDTNVSVKLSAPKTNENADLDFCFDDVHENENDDHGGDVDERVDVDPPSSPSLEKSHDDLSDEDAIVGSIPVPRGMPGGNIAFSSRPQPLYHRPTAAPTVHIRGGDGGGSRDIFELVEDAAASLSGAGLVYSSTAPANGDIAFRRPQI